MRTASSLGGGGIGWAKTFTTSTSRSRRPASMHRLPLTITWRDFKSCWICDQDWPGSHSPQRGRHGLVHLAGQHFENLIGRVGHGGRD